MACCGGYLKTQIFFNANNINAISDGDIEPTWGSYLRAPTVQMA